MEDRDINRTGESDRILWPDGNGECKESDAAAEHHLKPKTILCKRYQVAHVIGEGGFGITYAAWDLVLEMRTAIKEYYPVDYVMRNEDGSVSVVNHLATKEEAYAKGLKSFLQEAKTMAKMEKQPEIVMVRDYFEENNTAYIVMEYVNGTNLHEIVKQSGPIAPEEFFPLIKPLFGALENLHRSGLLHRDISPHNLMVEDGRIRLLDFGCAREEPFGRVTLTISLKQGYAPIEQYQKRGQGPWTDVYALSATIYYCLTGIRPPQALDRILEDELVPLEELGIDIPDWQEKALMKGMAINPVKRYRSIHELYLGLYEEYADEENSKLHEASETEPDEQFVDASEDIMVTESRPLWPWIAVLVGILLLCFVIIISGNAG